MLYHYLVFGCLKGRYTISIILKGRGGSPPECGWLYEVYFKRANEAAASPSWLFAAI